MTWKKSTNLVIGIGISIVCLWLALRNTHFSVLLEVSKNADRLWLGLAAVSLILAIITRSIRWVVLLEVKRGAWNSIWSQAIGYLFTNLLPMRLGEVARVYVMSTRCNLPFFQVGASAIIERLSDVSAVILAFILILPWMNIPPSVSLPMKILASAAGFVFIAIFLLFRFRTRLESFFSKAQAYLPWLSVLKISTVWSELIQGIAPFVNDWKIFSKSVFWTITTWTFSIGMYYAVLRAFHPGSTIIEAIFMTVSLSCAVSIPSSPGFIGIFQFVGQQALVIPFGDKYDETTALAIALSAHAIYYILTTFLGMIGYWKIGLSMAELLRKMEKYH